VAWCADEDQVALRIPYSADERAVRAEARKLWEKTCRSDESIPGSNRTLARALEIRITAL
jgi:hypothetical protein